MKGKGVFTKRKINTLAIMTLAGEQLGRLFSLLVGLAMSRTEAALRARCKPISIIQYVIEVSLEVSGTIAVLGVHMHIYMSVYVSICIYIYIYMGPHKIGSPVLPRAWGFDKAGRLKTVEAWDAKPPVQRHDIGRFFEVKILHCAKQTWNPTRGPL